MYADACSTADAVRNGTERAGTVADRTLARIAEYNDDLGAFVFVDADGARERAAQVDAMVEAGEDPGPLAGVPFGIKELEQVQGWPATDGSELLAERVAQTTSTFVMRMCAAGAVPIGLTHSPEFGRASYTMTALHGVCRNPWDLALTPGGSSGGSSAAVAADLVPLATGTDGAGSIRIPASWSGLVGLKPTYGRVPRGPVSVGMAHTHVAGALTRTVRDAARFLDCVVGHDERDPSSLPAPPFRFESRIEELDPAGRRATWSADLGFAVCDPVVEQVTRAAFEQLVSGAGLIDQPLDVRLPDCGAAFQTIVTPDTYSALRDILPPDDASVDPNVRLFFDGAFAYGIPDVAAAQEARAELVDRIACLFEQTDFIVTPATQTPAFTAEGPMPPTIAGEPVSHMGSIGVTFPFNLSGHPAISLPAGFVGSAPIGLQIVAPRQREDLLLAVAARYAAIAPWQAIAPRYQ